MPLSHTVDVQDSLKAQNDAEVVEHACSTQAVEELTWPILINMTSHNAMNELLDVVVLCNNEVGLIVVLANGELTLQARR
jgi:hypothetical protein